MSRDVAMTVTVVGVMGLVYGLAFGAFLGVMFEAQLLGRWDAWKVKRSERFKVERDQALDRANVADDRVAWLEQRYGLDTQVVFIDGTATPVSDPMQTRPVQRG